MTNIFEEYADRDELMRDLDAAIARKTDREGRTVYRLPNGEADELRAKFDAARKESERESKRRRELESRVDDLARERADALAELERARSAEPSETNDALKRSLERANASQARIAALEAELEPLRKENAAYKSRETRATIEAQLVEAARKLDCCETALRDVKRLAPLFRLNEDGLALTEDGKLVSEVLREELELSPHWLNRSQGGSASPGSLERPVDAAERFRRALQGRDFADVLRCAPREPVERRF